MGKLALVTGAGTGIGRSISLALADKGYDVGLIGRRKEKLDQVAEEIRRVNSKAYVWQADVSNEEQIRQVVEGLREMGNGLDLLVNNAGLGIFGRPLTPEEFNQVFSVNVTGVYALTRMALPLLEKRKGAVINIGSATVDRPFENEYVYMASKGAIAAMTKGMAASWGNKGIRVNLIQPGVIASDFNTRAGIPEKMAMQMYEDSVKFNALPRTGLPQDVANAVVFLASEEAQFITGATLHVDGGFSLGTVKQGS